LTSTNWSLVIFLSCHFHCYICTDQIMVKLSHSHLLSQLCDLRVGAHLCLHGPELAVSCRHSSVMWVVGHTCPTYCRYLRASTKLYCLVIEARVCWQLAQSWCLMVRRPGVEPVIFSDFFVTIVFAVVLYILYSFSFLLLLLTKQR